MQHLLVTKISYFLVQEENRRNTPLCNKAIMLLTDGAPESYEEIFNRRNWQTNSDYKPVCKHFDIFGVFCMILALKPCGDHSELLTFILFVCPSLVPHISGHIRTFPLKYHKQTYNNDTALCQMILTMGLHTIELPIIF